jgi:citrate synthase
MDQWVYDITHHTWVHENLKKLMEGFHYDAHPMGMLVSGVAALSTFYPEAKDGSNAETRRLQIIRLIAKMPTLAAFAYRHSLGLPYNYPDNELSYTGNFLNMLFKATEAKYHPNSTLERALEVLFILHADHEQNCSANAVRAVGSSQVDPYCAVAAGVAALYGPLHGGANEEVLRMLAEIGSKDRIPAFIKSVKEGKGKLMGFGHRVYKNYDPRAKIIKRMADEVFEVTRPSALLPVALELERIALEDEYFRLAQALPEHGLLLRADLSGPGAPGGDVPRALRHRPNERLAGPVAGDARRPRAEDRPAPAALSRLGAEALRRGGQAGGGLAAAPLSRRAARSREVRGPGR